MTTNSMKNINYEIVLTGNLVHSVQGYLSHCQDQLPNLCLFNQIPEPSDRYRCLAQLWKENGQIYRRDFEISAAKNEPHCGEPGMGGYGKHPRLTPHEIQIVLDALATDSTSWNLNERADYEESDEEANIGGVYPH